MSAFNCNSIRLSNYDYTTPGAYFVTVCAHNRKPVFGHLADETVCLNLYGNVVQNEWIRTANIRRDIDIDEFIVMPDHFHGIVIIKNRNTVGATGRSPLHDFDHLNRPHGPAKRSLGALIAGFKSAATQRINELRHTPGVPVWQRNYYEHIIRNDTELNQLRKYIRENPLKISHKLIVPSPNSFIMK